MEPNTSVPWNAQSRPWFLILELLLDALLADGLLTLTQPDNTGWRGWR